MLGRSRLPLPWLVVLMLLVGACSDADQGLVSPTAGERPSATGSPSPPDADGGGAGEPGTAQRGQIRVEPVPDEEGSPPVPADPGPLPEAAVALVGPDGARLELAVEVAADPGARQRGLMLRPAVTEGAGMLFLFPEDHEGGFWMRNTLVPLDIAYVAADGEVVDVLTMAPCEEDPCPGYRPDGAYRYALEVEAGVLTDAGVDDGWRLELPEDLPAAS